MAQPVWVLSVDLQTKTATFQSGMAEAAKSARGAFTSIQSGAGEMAAETSESFLNVRASLGILDNSIRGNHAAAMADLIRLFAQSSVVMAALPLAATAGGIMLIGGVILATVKALQAWREAQEKVRGETTQFGTALQTVFNGLDEKLLQAGIRTDELRNDHLGALRNELELIDKQSMDEIVRAFGEIDKAADGLFADLKSHWYTFGIGSAGASHALAQFKTQYESLLAQGKDKDASNLLGGTLESAKGVLAAQQQAKAALDAQKGKAGTDVDDQIKYAKASVALKAAGVGFTEKEVTAQQALVDALNAQVGVEGKIAALKGTDKGNATMTTGHEMSAQRAAAAREAAEHTGKMGDLALAAEREQATVGHALHQSTIAERLASDITLANKEYALQQQSNAQLIAALDKGGKDYNNQLKALHDKAAEETAQHANTIASLQGKAAIEQYRKDLADLEESEREKIDATDQGSKERLAVIDAALKDEQARNLQDTAHYRELLTERVQVAAQAAGAEAQARENAGKKAATAELALALAAAKEKQALENSARPQTANRQTQEAIKAANDELALKQHAAAQEMAALDKTGKDYENKLKAIQAEQKQLVQQHENQITAIKDKALTEQNQRQQTSLRQLEEMTSSGLTQVLMGHKSFAAMMSSIGNQVASGMMQNALMSIMTLDMTKEKEAAAAARKMYLAGAQFPFPANIVMAPVLGAAGFAAMMAFHEGGIVPGVGTGDTVPAMLTPGEGVIPKSVMDGLSTSRDGNAGRSVTHVVHMRPVYHLQALDTEGMGRVLQKHSDQLEKHFKNTVRKMNR